MSIKFVETKVFTRKLRKIWDGVDYAKFQLELAADPTVGDVIPHSGGLRKIRRAAQGRGKRGGFRVIYFWAVSREVVVMLDVYAKNEKSGLSTDELKRLASAKRDILGEQ
ncbi:MAG TPA: hypothetical protein VK612_12660 [Pyrinomonadaceae bacterium]|nr:hypothetical protein [Pyrinomonadaceae bacterium]